jgi:3-phosphoshikimate 1-carboxyvinyltransferase
MSLKIAVPGSKSIANRALILNHLCGDKTELKNLPDCDDVKLMLKALNDIKNHQGTGPLQLNTGFAGTTTRFISAVTSLLPYPCTIDGSQRMRERPIKELTDALRQLGASLTDNEGFPPIEINSIIPKGGKLTIKGHISSQYLSAILMIAPFLQENTEIDIEGDLCSKPYIDITLNLLEQFGLKVENENYKKFKIEGQQVPEAPKSLKIEADCSSASYIGAYAALNPSKEIIITNLSLESIQGDIKFIEYLKTMGCKIETAENGITIKGPQNLSSLGEIDMNSTPDLVMTFAVLAIFTEGTTIIKNVANLRIKETDRLEALQNELTKIEVKVETGPDYIKITGQKEIHATINAEIETYEDHRMAMSFGILTNNYPGIKIQNPVCVSKSYTTFWNDINKLK